MDEGLLSTAKNRWARRHLPLLGILTAKPGYNNSSWDWIRLPKGRLGPRPPQVRDASTTLGVSSTALARSTCHEFSRPQTFGAHPHRKLYASSFWNGFLFFLQIEGQIGTDTP